MDENDDMKKMIFIVDDEPEMLMSLQRPLQTKYKVLTTGRSLDVMDILRTERVDCMLMDIRMPGMTGIELLKEIKFTYPHIPVLIMTGHGDENDTITSLKYGAVGYLKKPIDIYKLFDEIERVTVPRFQSLESKKQVDVLFLDDDQEFLESVKKALSGFPYILEMVTNTGDAFKIINSKSFDIVVVDVQLPGGMSGLEFLERARQVQAGFIPIVITGVSSQELAIEALKQGAFDYIKKPLDVKELISAIERSKHKLEINREIQLKNQELLVKEKSLQSLNDEIIMQKNYLENIVKSISNMLIITADNGIIKTINDATLHVLGYEPQELVGQSIDVVLPNVNIDEFIKTIINNKGLGSSEKEFLKKDKSKIIVLFSGSLIRNRNGEVEGFVFVAQDISERKEAEQELHRLSYYDTLTNLPNRLYFEMMAQQAVVSAKKNNALLAFLYMDLDGFKSVNDRLGHPVGDELLKEVAKRLQNAFRPQDFIARMGGDEFVACLGLIQEKSDAGIVAQRIINILNRPYYIDNNELSIGVSIGIALYPETATTFNQLFKNSDVALYKAKHAGRNQYQFFNKQLDIEYSQQLKLENALRFSLGRDEFHMVYQPIYEINTKKIVAIEALLRWCNEELGFVSPEQFIPIAEYNGLIIPIGEWMMNTSIRQFANWKSQIEIKCHLSLNISAYQLDRGQYLIDILQNLCQKYDVSPELIKIELTETALMHNPKQSDKILTDLSKLGFTVLLDDFGQGFSSLSLLSRLPVSSLKIDKQFVKELTQHKSEIIVKSIIGLSKSLSLSVIAEGVETKEQLDTLTMMGCEYVQGFFWSRPIEEHEVVALLKGDL